MKLTGMLISALAAVASAAPAATESLEKRGRVDLGEYNNFAFANEDLQYFNAVNELDLRVFVELSARNNLDIAGFKKVFVRDVLDIDALLQLQQIALLIQLADIGLFRDIDLAIIKIETIDLGILSGIGRFDVASLIDDSLAPKLQDVIRKTKVKAIIVSDDSSKES
ncbi:hypothetical protein DL766_006189 [Monosporascus sp. MC13-8B]|uniref:Uncharacterized protein n=1 Tax=Monosporascus cannonballus TaxID=155416 RepID=A0ABY0GWY5_9PEZI|nr:hypothetical protein DL762_008543 [Monosporascus cannonballus]RYO79702.1 hypothetical protein DL763_009172 [Monosporascus cannonballus]RYP27814.1 hypothetical protein DL766_006189 [Monosporascus sp. MC13-8B]